MEKPSWGLQTIHNLFGDFTLCVHSEYERSIMSKHSCWVAVFPNPPTNSAAPDPKIGMQTFLPPCRLYISNQSLERHSRYSSREENSARPYLLNFAKAKRISSPFSITLPQVKHHFLLWKQVVTTRHLGQTGKAWGHHGAIMPAVNALLELLAEGRALGARADRRHPFCQDEKH